MNNDLLTAISVKVERLYNRIVASEVKNKESYDKLKEDFASLKSEIEKTNNILEMIYLEIKKQ